MRAAYNFLLDHPVRVLLWLLGAHLVVYGGYLMQPYAEGEEKFSIWNEMSTFIHPVFLGVVMTVIGFCVLIGATNQTYALARTGTGLGAAVWGAVTLFYFYYLSANVRTVMALTLFVLFVYVHLLVQAKRYRLPKQFEEGEVSH